MLVVCYTLYKCVPTEDVVCWNESYEPNLHSI